LAVRTLPAFLKERIIMRSTFTVNHNEHVSNPSPFQTGVTSLTLSNAAAL